MKTKNPMWQGASGKLGTYIVYELNGQTVMRVRRPATTRISEKQAIHRSTYSSTAAHWAHVPDSQKMNWGRLALRLPRWETDAPGTPLTGYNAFCQSATGRAALSLSMLKECPLLDIPAFLPNIQLTAQMTGNTLSLHLGGAEYGAALQVFGVKPVYPFVAPPTRFALLGVLPNGIGTDGADVGAWYRKQFPKVCAGCVVTLKLVPVSVSGFRGQPLTVTATVG